MKIEYGTILSPSKLSKPTMVKSGRSRTARGKGADSRWKYEFMKNEQEIIYGGEAEKKDCLWRGCDF